MREWLNQHPKSKKHLRCLLVFLIIILGIVLAIHVHHVEKQQEMNKEAYSHKKEIDHFVKVDDKYHRIKSVTIDYSEVRANPMGGIIVESYVNNDKSLRFSVDVYHYYQEDKNGKYHRKLSAGSGVESNKLDNFLTKGDKNSDR